MSSSYCEAMFVGDVDSPKEGQVTLAEKEADAGPRRLAYANFFRWRKFDKQYLLTNDYGEHAFVDDTTFRRLIAGKQLDDTMAGMLSHKGLIVDSVNQGTIIHGLQRYYSFLDWGPSLHLIITTLRCNMGCKYCHASSVPLDRDDVSMDARTVDKTVDFILQSPSPSLNIEFQGGESLVELDTIKRFIDRFEEKKGDKKICYILVSNLSYLTEEIAQYLCEKNVDVCTSLDGPKEVHDFNRPYAKGSGYDEVIKGIATLRQVRTQRGDDNKLLGALATITRESLKYPEGIVDEYVKQGMVLIHLRWMNPLGVAKPMWKRIGYTADEFLEFWKASLEHILSLNKKGTTIIERGAQIILKKMDMKQSVGYVDLQTPHGSAISAMAYHHNGDIYGCDEGRMIEEMGKEGFKLGNVKDDTLADVMNNPVTRSLFLASVNDTSMCDTCAYKPYCGLDPIYSFVNHGSIAPVSLYDERCKMLMGIFDWIFSKLEAGGEDAEILRSWTDFSLTGYATEMGRSSKE